MSLPNDQNKTSTLAESLRDLAHTRDEVVGQVMQAPKRVSCSSVVTRLFVSACSPHDPNLPLTQTHHFAAD